MPIVVEVKSEADYAKWLDEQHVLLAQVAEAEKASLNASVPMEELMALGETTYVAYCAACHQVSGTGLPPAFPALKGSPVATGDIATHIATVFNGKVGTGMQGYGKQLSLKQIAAVVTYERNAWGNNTGDAVQASDVQAAVTGAVSNLANTAKDVVAEVETKAVAAVQEVAPTEIFLKNMQKKN